MIDELSTVLAAAHGSSGRDGFDPSTEHDAVVLIAHGGEELLGCGAVRPLPGGRGAGS